MDVDAPSVCADRIDPDRVVCGVGGLVEIVFVSVIRWAIKRRMPFFSIPE
jgi:hypothetical protein